MARVCIRVSPLHSKQQPVRLRALPFPPLFMSSKCYISNFACIAISLKYPVINTDELGHQRMCAIRLNYNGNYVCCIFVPYFKLWKVVSLFQSVIQSQVFSTQGRRKKKRKQQLLRAMSYMVQSALFVCSALIALVFSCRSIVLKW